MITTDICGRNLIAINSNGQEIVVETAPKDQIVKVLKLFLQIENQLVKELVILFKNKL